MKDLTLLVILFIGFGMILSVFITTFFDQYGLDENYIPNQKQMTTDSKIALFIGAGLMMFSGTIMAFWKSKLQKFEKVSK